eukprot:10184396-Alexandrium_andersonii.AAC.1
MQTRLRRSKLELFGSRNRLRIGARNSQGLRPAQLFALLPNLTTSVVLEVPEVFRGGSEGF